MTRLPDLHRGLVDAARRQQQQQGEAARAGDRRWTGARRLRLLAVALTGLLASTTIALAAGGVIIGSPVPADKGLHRYSGLGVPVKSGGSRLLGLRVADPYGGPPWGMRIVRTSREEVCLQIGRIHDGKLGALGVDGAFGNDGALHPVPASALPGPRQGGMPPMVSNGDTQCAQAGRALSAGEVPIPSSAVASQPRSLRAIAALNRLPRKDLRDVYFGVLGPQAVSVTYSEGGAEHTQHVVPGSGAYLIVTPTSPGQRFGDGGVGTLSTPYGDLFPGPREPLKKIAYRLGGKLCERGLHWERKMGAWLPTGPASDVAHPCPEHRGPPSPAERTHRVKLHRPVHARVLVKHGVATGLRIAFKAPYAVEGVGSAYTMFLPDESCHTKNGKAGSGEEDGVGEPINRNVRRGAEVSTVLPYPFRVKRVCRSKTVVVRVTYEGNGAPHERVIVGEVTVKQPPGTRNGAAR